MFVRCVVRSSEPRKRKKNFVLIVQEKVDSYLQYYY